MHELSTHLSPQLSPQPHFCPFFATPKTNEMGTSGQHFFNLHHPPFNTSFNTPFNASFTPCLVAPWLPPLHPPAPTISTFTPPHFQRWQNDVANPTHRARHKAHKSPLQRILYPLPSVPTHSTKRAARHTVFSGHAQRLDAVLVVAFRCAQLDASSHLFALPIKAN